MKLCLSIIKHLRIALGLAATALLAVSCATSNNSPNIVGTGNAHNITRLTFAQNGGEDKNNPAVSPDGKTVAFEEYRGRLCSIWTMDTSGHNMSPLTSLPCNEVHPTWLPDSRSIAFASDHLPGSYDLWSRLASGGGGSTLIARGRDMIYFAPACSPTENKIAFMAHPRAEGEKTPYFNGVKQFMVLEKNLPDIWTVTTHGTDLTQLTQGAYPTWSPDGSLIAFASNKSGNSGNWEIWTMNANNSSSTVQLTSSGKNHLAPSFSPDGKWIVYTSNDSGNYDLWMMKADGSQQTQLITDKYETANPCWGSDGNIYFCSNKSGTWEIWKLSSVSPN